MGYLRGRAGGLAILIAGAGACYVAPGCSSPFSSCEARRECPVSAAGAAGADGSSADSAGTSGTPGDAAGAPGNSSAGAPADGGSESGTAGMGGSSGADGGLGGEAGGTPRECVHDSDCSDHLACNGAESCLDGACVSGVAPCVNPDLAHCDITCAELNGGATCAVKGQDKDKDGHLSSACAATPGDDCNDNDGAVHPGVAELCNGIDDNCNGLVDVNDGLTLTGSTVQIGVLHTSAPTIAWAPDSSLYGLTYYDPYSSLGADLFFETVSAAGVVVNAPKPFNDGTTLADGALASGQHALTWGGDGFGVVWSSNGTFFRRISSYGALDTTLPQLNSTGSFFVAVARVAGGAWGVVSSQAGGPSKLMIEARTISAGGVVSAAQPITSIDSRSPSVAASGSNFVVGYSVLGSPSSSVAALWSAAFTTPKPLTVLGMNPVVASGPNGFAIAATSTSASAKPQIYAYNSSGAVQCGPVGFADGTFAPSSIVATATGYLVVSDGVVRVQEVLANCTLGQLVTVDAGPALGAKIAGSASGYGVVWTDTSADISRRRIFGSKFCN